MKILIITPTIYEYPNRIGGAETYVLNLANAMASNPGVEVGILGFSLNKTGKWQDKNVFYNISKSRPLKKNPSNPIPFFNFFELRNWDVIYLQQFHTWLTFLCIIFAKIFGKKIILTDHNGGGATYNRRLKIDKWIDLFLSTSQLSFQEIHLNPKKMASIYGGVDLDKFTPDESHREGLLFVGRAHPIKGILPFLSAAASKQYSGKITLALGVNYDNEEYFNKIEKFIVENQFLNCTLKKNLSFDFLVKEYRSHKWTILPSINQIPHESLGLTVLESLACNTPVAISPYCGIGEMFIEKLAFIHVFDEEFSFLDAIASTCPSGSRDWAMKNASWEKVSNRVLSELERL